MIYFLLSLLLFDCAWLSRYTLLLSLPIFFYPLIVYTKKIKQPAWVLLLAIALVLLAGGCILGSYNYLKFGSIFDTGLSYHMAASRYAEIVEARKFFSIRYVLHNIQVYFFNFLLFSHQFPYLRINPEGTSLFILYPSSFLFYFLVRSYSEMMWPIKAFVMLAGITIVLTFGLLLNYFATGWQQFGLRYLLDIMPIGYLLLLFILNRIPKKVLLILFCYEMIINIYGIIVYFYFH